MFFPFMLYICTGNGHSSPTLMFSVVRKIRERVPALEVNLTALCVTCLSVLLSMVIPYL